MQEPIRTNLEFMRGYFTEMGSDQLSILQFRMSRIFSAIDRLSVVYIKKPVQKVEVAE